MTLPTIKIIDIEFVQALCPEVLLPERNCIFIIEKTTCTSRQIKRIANLIGQVATFHKPFRGWFLQRKGPGD